MELNDNDITEEIILLAQDSRTRGNLLHVTPSRK